MMRNVATVNKFHRNKWIKGAIEENYKQKSNSPISILRQTKRLTQSNDNFRDYLHYYQKITQKYTYRLPNLTIYPLRKNDELIPISYRTEYIPSEWNTERSTTKTNNNSRNIFSLKHNSHNTLKLNTIEVERDKFFELRLNNYSKISTLSNYQINNTEEINLQDINRLKDELKKVIKNQNETYIKQKEFYLTSKKEKYNFILKCQSFLLEFVNMKTYETSIVHLPFDVIPLYFLIEFQMFKTFLSNVIEIQNGKISIHYDKFLNHLTIYEKYIEIKDNFTKSTYYQNQKLFKLQYDWLIDKNDIYKLKINLPSIILESIDNKTLLIKKISKTLILKLIFNNFIKWDNILINDLFSSKKFRYIIKRIINGDSNCKYQGKNIPLDNEVKIPLNAKTYEFFNTNNNLNFFQVIYPHKISLIRKEKDEEEEKAKDISIFELDLKQMQKINKIKDYWSYSGTIGKCLVESKRTGKVTLNLNLINAIDEDFIKIIKANNTKVNRHNLSFKKNNINIKIEEPMITYIEIETFKKIEMIVPNIILDELTENDLSQWGNTLLKYKDVIDELSTDLIKKERSVSVSVRRSIKSILVRSPTRDFRYKRQYRRPSLENKSQQMLFSPSKINKN